jgi:hypothetical protein
LADWSPGKGHAGGVLEGEHTRRPQPRKDSALCVLAPNLLLLQAGL